MAFRNSSYSDATLIGTMNLKNLAQNLGISETTVSRALNGYPEVSERTRQRVPIGHFGTPEDIAYGVLYLISDESRFMTGAELVIDGGMMGPTMAVAAVSAAA